jgi:hypothetical protein
MDKRTIFYNLIESLLKIFGKPESTSNPNPKFDGVRRFVDKADPYILILVTIIFWVIITPMKVTENEESINSILGFYKALDVSRMNKEIVYINLNLKSIEEFKNRNSVTIFCTLDHRLDRNLQSMTTRIGKMDWRKKIVFIPGLGIGRLKKIIGKECYCLLFFYNGAEVRFDKED